MADEGGDDTWMCVCTMVWPLTQTTCSVCMNTNSFSEELAKKEEEDRARFTERYSTAVLHLFRPMMQGGRHEYLAHQTSAHAEVFPGVILAAGSDPALGPLKDAVAGPKWLKEQGIGAIVNCAATELVYKWDASDVGVQVFEIGLKDTTREGVDGALLDEKVDAACDFIGACSSILLREATRC